MLQNLSRFALFVCVGLGSSTALAQPSGIYVEYYVPPPTDLCPCSASFGDGWLPVPGFAHRHGGCSCAGAAQAGLATNSNVSFTGNSGTTYRVFHATGLGIGTITVSGSGFVLLVGAASSDASLDLNTPIGATAGTPIGNISASGGTVQVSGSGTIGTVSANTVYRVDAATSTGAVSSSTFIGTVKAPGVANVTAASGITLVDVAGSGVSDYTSTVSTSTSNIGTVRVIGARMRGNVQADAGSIGQVTSNVGIGPSSGSAVTVRARNGIATVTAPTINANVDARYGGGTGPIQTFTASTGTFTGSLLASSIGSSGTGFAVAGTMPAAVTINGATAKAFTVTGTASGTVTLTGAVSQPVSFNGGYSASTLTLGALSSSLSITGNMSAATTVASTSGAGSINVSGTLPSTNTLTITGTHAGALDFNGLVSGLIKVGDSLSGTMTFGTSGVPGLDGQIVVNSANGSGTWTGNVLLQNGAVAVSPTGNVYDAVSSTFGATDANGGAVGRGDTHSNGGAYKLHGKDSSPVQGGIATNWYSTPPSLAAFEAASPRTKKSD